MNIIDLLTLIIHFIILNIIKCNGEEARLKISATDFLAITAIQASSEVTLLENPDLVKSEYWIFFRSMPISLIKLWCNFVDYFNRNIHHDSATEQQIKTILLSVKSKYDDLLPIRSNHPDKRNFYSRIYLLLQNLSCENSLDLLLLAEASDVGIYNPKESIIILIASICSSIDLKKYEMRNKITIFFRDTGIRDKLLVHGGKDLIDFAMNIHDTLDIKDSIPKPNLDILSIQDPKFLNSIEPKLVFDLTPKSNYNFFRLACHIMIEMYNSKIQPKSIFKILMYILWRSVIIVQSVLILEIVKLFIEISRDLHIGIENFLSYKDYQEKIIQKLKEKFGINLQIENAINDCKQDFSGNLADLVPRPSTDVQKKAKLKRRRKGTLL